MIEAFGSKNVMVAAPIALVASGTLAVATVDTFGYEYARISVDFGVMDTVPATLKVQQSDASNMTGAIDVPGTVVGTDNNDTGAASTLPTAGSAGKRFVFQIDLRGKKRYLKLILINSATGTTGVVEAWCTLDRPHESPGAVAAAGLLQRMVA
jgi:hypothetical protein